MQDVQSLLPAGMLKDSDIIGISLDGDTLLVNFSNTFIEAGEGLTEGEDRLLAYSLVNTLLHAANAKRVAFFVGGSQIDVLRMRFPGRAGSCKIQALFLIKQTHIKTPTRHVHELVFCCFYN